MPSGKQSEINRLRKIIEQRGFKVVPSGSGHWRVLDAKGKVVVDDNGPVIMSSTSSDVRGRVMAVKRLMNAGVLLVDPWANQKPKDGSEDDGGDQLSEQEIAAREAAAERDRLEDQRRSDRTHAVRERLEPVVVLIGGWDKRGNMREIGVVAHYFAERSKLPSRWSSAEAASENAEALRKGATLSPNIAALWEKLLDELETWPDITLRWMQLLREAKGLEESTVGGDDVGDAVVDEGRADTGTPVRPSARPSALALELAFELGVGRTDSTDRARLLQLVERVVDIEIEVGVFRRAVEDASREAEGTGVQVEKAREE